MHPYHFHRGTRSFPKIKKIEHWQVTTFHPHYHMTDAL
jgi:hypothetical protein